MIDRSSRLRIGLIVILFVAILVTITTVLPYLKCSLMSPLGVIVRDDATCLQSRIENGMPPDFTLHSSTSNSRKLIHEAIDRGAIGCIMILLNSGADLNAETSLGESPLMRLIVNDTLEETERRKFFDRLVKCDLNHKSKSGETALHLSCLYGSPRDIRDLIIAGAQLDITDDLGRTPLDIAGERSSLEGDSRYLKACIE
jgi:ankyrin repeat protein